MAEEPYTITNEQIGWIALFTINEGQLDKANSIMKDFINSVDKNEPGALTYQWYLSPDERQITVIERFSCQDAAIAHATGECATNHFPRILEISTVEVTVYGTPNEKLTGILQGLGLDPVGHTYIGGIQR
ncbi:putative quinol monooxygenase [Thermodesulfobacteriota bacterium]